VGAKFCFDEIYQFPKGSAQDGIVVPHFREITARVVLCPELIGQAIRKILEHGGSSIEIHCLGNESAQIVDPAELSTAGDQVCLQKPFGRLL
jgi:hypothetical protein